MTRIDGPFPIGVTATQDGATLDISLFLVRAVFMELFQQAAEDPEGVGEELADMYALAQSAQHQGPDSAARHEFDDRMEKMLDQYADGGTLPLYGDAVVQARDALAEIAKPRPVPAQREAGAA